MKLLSLIACCIVPIGAVLACGCDVSYSPTYLQEAFERSNKVFRARVLSVDEISSRTKIRDVGWIGRILVRAEVAVTETFKGNTSELVYVVTSPASADCGVPIQPGDDYVFFASEIDEVSCSGSRAKRFARQYNWDWESYLVEIELLAR